MARITVQEANGWTEKTKLEIGALDMELLDQVETQVLARLAAQFNVSTWVDASSTPAMVSTVIAMFYVSWIYDRTYSEDQEDLNDYAALLRAQAEGLLVGILDGSIVIVELPEGEDTQGDPAFYPTDASSASAPTELDSSLGPAVFSLSTKW